MLKVYVSLHHCSIVNDFLCHCVMQVQPAVIDMYLADSKPYRCYGGNIGCLY